MTGEEAIIQLKGLKEHCSEMSTQGEIWVDDVNALDMAIKALEQEPILDKIVTEVKALFKEPAYYIPNYDAYKKVLEIINKCKVESEEKNGRLDGRGAGKD